MVRKKIYILLLCCFTAFPAIAQYRSKGVQHFIGLSVGGATAEDICGKSAVSEQIGAGANLRFHYELHASKWIFGFGVAAEYQYLSDTVADFIDAQNWTDRDGDACAYEYVYQGYHEADHAVGIGIPVYFGREFGDYVYWLLGARFCLPILTHSTVRTRLLTQGNY